MYEYRPAYSKKKEKKYCLVLTLAAVVLLALSQIPQMPLPALWQTVAVAMLAVAILLLSRYVLRGYAYRIEESEQGRDLVILMQTGKRTRVVCRISVAYIDEVIRITPENREPQKQARRGHPVWLYYAEWQAEGLCQLHVRTPDEDAYLLLQSDDRLLDFLRNL